MFRRHKASVQCDAQERMNSHHARQSNQQALYIFVTGYHSCAYLATGKHPTMLLWLGLPSARNVSVATPTKPPTLQRTPKWNPYNAVSRALGRLDTGHAMLRKRLQWELFAATDGSVTEHGNMEPGV